MVAVITPTVDATLRRVQVSLTGWSSDGPVSVSGTDGSVSWLVRSITATSGGATAGYDYEAPLGRAVTYSAMDGSTPVTSGSVTVPGGVAMLRAPGLPSLDATVEVVRVPAVSYERDQTVLRPLGRRTAIVQSGTLAAGSWELEVRTYTKAASQALGEMLATAPVLLLVAPGWEHDREYVAVASVAATPAVHYYSTDGTGAGAWRTWTIPCTVVRQPVGGMYGDPTSSWQAIKDAYPTWAAVKAAKATWLDVLKGV